MENSRRIKDAPLLVVAGVILRDGKVLLARRFPGGHHGRLWEFPGGKVEPGETEPHALIRELAEELGVEVAVERHCLTVEHAYPHRKIRLAAYWCRITAGEPRPIGCEKIHWADPSELLESTKDFPMPEADVPIARHVANAFCR